MKNDCWNGVDYKKTEEISKNSSNFDFLTISPSRAGLSASYGLQDSKLL